MTSLTTRPGQSSKPNPPPPGGLPETDPPRVASSRTPPRPSTHDFALHNQHITSANVTPLTIEPTRWQIRHLINKFLNIPPHVQRCRNATDCARTAQAR